MRHYELFCKEYLGGVETGLETLHAEARRRCGSAVGRLARAVGRAAGGTAVGNGLSSLHHSTTMPPATLSPRTGSRRVSVQPHR